MGGSAIKLANAGSRSDDGRHFSIRNFPWQPSARYATPLNKRHADLAQRFGVAHKEVAH
jgi:hypothetical protein